MLMKKRVLIELESCDITMLRDWKRGKAVTSMPRISISTLNCIRKLYFLGICPSLSFAASSGQADSLVQYAHHPLSYSHFQSLNCSYLPKWLQPLRMSEHSLHQHLLTHSFHLRHLSRFYRLHSLGDTRIYMF